MRSYGRGREGSFEASACTIILRIRLRIVAFFTMLCGMTTAARDILRRLAEYARSRIKRPVKLRARNRKSDRSSFLEIL